MALVQFLLSDVSLLSFSFTFVFFLYIYKNPLSAGITLVDDGVEYTKAQISDVLEMISASGIQRKVSAFGILGVVKFLNGFYLNLITKRRRVALIGQHFVYKIEDTLMLPVCDTPGVAPLEARYFKAFCNVDLSSNFYFSYTYDLTSPLQRSMHIPTPEEVAMRASCEPIRPDPDLDFAWNHHLLSPLGSRTVRDWAVHIIHGFVAQSNLNIFGRSIYITLIARRTRHYAGTRFLKRGANHQGWPANYVETEQIAHDASTLNHCSGELGGGNITCF